VSSYDYPFNERIRTLLRLEDLFGKTFHYLGSDHELDHHTALITLFQILDVIDRAELKSDLLQELDRQKVVMESLRGKPSIAEDLLDDLIGEIDKTARALRAFAGKLGQVLRDNEWLMGIKQRAAIPGGVCEFDVPSYHYWLGQSASKRKQELEGWLAPLIPLYDGLRIVLHILRGSGISTHQIADHGVYQQMLGGAKPAQMVRVRLNQELDCFPEVSANKYAISIRFFELDGTGKPRQCDAEVDFELTLCNL
jgi:cell division protein ZapD